MMKIVLSISLLYQSAGYKLMVPVIWYSEEEGGNNAIFASPYQRRFLPQILPPTVLTFKTPQRHLNNPQLKANDSLPFGYGFFLLSLGICVALVAFQVLKHVFL